MSHPHEQNIDKSQGAEDRAPPHSAETSADGLTTAPDLSLLRDAFGFRFVMLARRWRQLVDGELARSQLTDATWAPLFHLHHGGDNISQSELAERLGLENSSLVRLLDLLEQRQLIERRVDPKDRRARRIMLTKAGRAEYTGLRVKILEIEHRLIADLNAHDVEQFHHLISRIEKRVDHETMIARAAK